MLTSCKLLPSVTMAILHRIMVNVTFETKALLEQASFRDRRSLGVYAGMVLDSAVTQPSVLSPRLIDQNPATPALSVPLYVIPPALPFRAMPMLEEVPIPTM